MFWQTRYHRHKPQTSLHSSDSTFKKKKGWAFFLPSQEFRWKTEYNQSYPSIFICTLFIYQANAFGENITAFKEDAVVANRPNFVTISGNRQTRRGKQLLPTPVTFSLVTLSLILPLGISWSMHKLILKTIYNPSFLPKQGNSNYNYSPAVRSSRSIPLSRPRSGEIMAELWRHGRKCLHYRSSPDHLDSTPKIFSLFCYNWLVM